MSKIEGLESFLEKRIPGFRKLVDYIHKNILVLFQQDQVLSTKDIFQKLSDDHEEIHKDVLQVIQERQRFLEQNIQLGKYIDKQKHEYYLLQAELDRARSLIRVLFPNPDIKIEIPDNPPILGKSTIAIANITPQFRAEILQTNLYSQSGKLGFGAQNILQIIIHGNRGLLNFSEVGTGTIAQIASDLNAQEEGLGNILYQNDKVRKDFIKQRLGEINNTPTHLFIPNQYHHKLEQQDEFLKKFPTLGYIPWDKRDLLQVAYNLPDQFKDMVEFVYGQVVPTKKSI